MERSITAQLGYEPDAAAHASDSLDLGVPNSVSRGVYRTFGKRVVDTGLVLLSLLFTIPVILICAAIIARDGYFPFFGHTRVGKDGKEFKCWKIRTMVPDAQQKLQEHLASCPAARAEWDETRKLKNDPRIVPFGSFLRKSSLDELPQIFNVLLGQMSLVGPRPVVREELSYYGNGQRAYLAMRPGITGLWQVSGRNDASYAERVRFDVSYYKDVSFMRDLSIIFQTLKVVVARNGY
ncbi:MAG: exopolysaccharide production protein ExoY [Roseibaca calidilacus]|uniref:Exopolysaccharide production protein ExoY n=1 Tax=Roseibaca calidilacus TaxID=1666912 RepID=A0A0P7YXI9_9RHOB|nr:sugar transferase [Roseibaca calidilacus]KPP95642.1 MAG: exopolysaccharide production protein ExoY [Roseibaca calidilacus]CUX81958.1 Sugar transferase involved in LPS biosynthesis (colanic, teichoic acid) [Roseibaca calidilacus]